MPLVRFLCRTATEVPSRWAYSVAMATRPTSGETTTTPAGSRPSQRLTECRHRRQAVDGNVEEALDLLRVQVERDDVVDARRLHQPGDEAGGDGLAPAVPLVGACIAEVGHDGRDPRGGRAATGVGEGQQLDEVVVDRRSGRLHEEDLAAAHRLVEPHRRLAVGEAGRRR